MNSTTLRLANKIGLINILSLNKGLKLEELISYSRHDEMNKIKKELGELFMVGSYPYTPADYIEIDYNSEGLKITLPVDMNRAIGLNIKEWIILRNLVSEKLEESDPNLDRELFLKLKEKIQSIVPTKDFIKYEELKESILKAIQMKKVIKFDYKKKDQIETRKVEPWLLFDYKNDYLSAFCRKSNSLRTFRLDLINNLEITDEPMITLIEDDAKIQTISNFLNFIHKSNSTSEDALLKIHKSVYYHISNTLELHTIELNNSDYILAKTKILEEDWFLSIIKGYGPLIRIKEPEHLVQKIKLDLNSVLIPSTLKKT